MQAAVNAGFKVVAIDAFADLDTQKLAMQVHQCKIKNNQFDAEEFLEHLLKINLNDCLGLCFGAGFEAQPELLASIAERLPLIGNMAKVVDATKMPQLFFSLCDSLKIAYPPTQLSRPVNSLGWLQKQIGGSGGAHIKQVLPLDMATDLQHYYQKKQVGSPISCLFLSDAKNTQVIGFNAQWYSASQTLPYRYAGAVSHIDLPEAVKSHISYFVQTASLNFGLKGINSADFLLDNEALYALEINPRLSATLDLYRAERGDLFAAHLQACLNLPVDWPVIDKKSRAHHIVYANKTAHVPLDMDWPDWVCDIPQPNSEIAAGQPICTVVAQARTAKLAQKKLLQRVAEL